MAVADDCRAQLDSGAEEMTRSALGTGSGENCDGYRDRTPCPRIRSGRGREALTDCVKRSIAIARQVTVGAGRDTRLDKKCGFSQRAHVPDVGRRLTFACMTS